MLRLLSILFFFLSISAFAQKKEGIDSFYQIQSTALVDSLKQLLATSKDDSNQVLLLHQLAYPILFSKPDSSMYYAQRGLKLALLIDYPKGQVLCNADIGAVWWIIGDYAKAEEILLQSFAAAESLNDAETYDWTLSFVVTIYRDQGKYNEALRYSLPGTAKHKYFSKGLWNVITGSVYQMMNKPDSALDYLQQGESGGYNFLMLAHTYAALGNNKLAFDYYKKAIYKLSFVMNYKDLADAYIGMAKLYERQNKLDSAIHYANQGLKIARNASFRKWVYETSLILSRIYEKDDVRQSLKYYKLAMAAKDSMFNLQRITENLSLRYGEQLRQQEARTAKMNYRNKVRVYSLLGAFSMLLLLAGILFRNSQQKQKAKVKIEKTYTELKAAQAQLIQSEKMASLGELTAGIAHEIQNPLNFVNNFSDTNIELVQEAKNELQSSHILEGLSILEDIQENSQKIALHGKRADSIVRSMIEHSRISKGEKQPTDINALLEEYLHLAYHGFKAKDKNFNVSIQTDLDENIGKVEIVPQEIGRVLLNLFNNAFYAVNEKGKQANDNYEPKVEVSSKRLRDRIEIAVKDNGLGVPPKVIDKVFQPFFTTKPTGQGTGLGLSLSYDIVKAHGGELKVESKEEQGATFIICLPYSNS